MFLNVYDSLFRFRLSLFFFFKQKTAYEMRISDWSSDVCSSDLGGEQLDHVLALRAPAGQCARGTELEVVGMGDDGQAGVPVLRHRFERGAIHGARRYRSA